MDKVCGVCCALATLLYTNNMVSGGRHPKKPIADALKAVAREGLQVVEIHRGHRWGALVCMVCGADLALHSTPRVPEDAARRVGRFDLKHRHKHEEEQ